MDWTIKIHSPGYTCHEGSVIPEKNEEYTVPFTCWQTVYYAHKKKFWKKNSPWVVTKTEVLSMWASNTYGVTLRNGDCIDQSGFQYLFTNRDEAIDFCLKKNERNKVKIYGE